MRLAVSFGCAVGRTSPLCQAVRNPLRNSSSVGAGLAAGSDRTGRSAIATSWVITNPPFRLSEQFVHQALEVAREGVAILARTVFIESVGRYNSLFRQMPPSKFAPFTERVAMVKGRLDRKASTATSYAWLVWEKRDVGAETKVIWIPPCRKQLERENDYPGAALG